MLGKKWYRRMDRECQRACVVEEAADEIDPSLLVGMSEMCRTDRAWGRTL